MGRGYIHTLRGGARAFAARCVCIALACPAALIAQPTLARGVPAFATAPAQAAILTPGTITKTADMDFGTIAQPVVAATVVMTASATPTCTVSAGTIHTGACRSAAFSVLGKKQQRVRMKDTTNGTVVLTGPGGATMQMTNLTIATSGLTSGAGGCGRVRPRLLHDQYQDRIRRVLARRHPPRRRAAGRRRVHGDDKPPSSVQLTIACRARRR